MADSSFVANTSVALNRFTVVRWPRSERGADEWLDRLDHRVAGGGTGSSIRSDPACRELGRSSGTAHLPMMISWRHGDAAGYLAATAEADAACQPAAGPACKPRLMSGWAAVRRDRPSIAQLGRSPEQISARRRKRIENGMQQPSGLRVGIARARSHGCALYRVLPRGELRRRAVRPPCARPSQCEPASSEGVPEAGRVAELCNMTNIKERPAAIAGSPGLPGRWEGDLILGAAGRQRRGHAAWSAPPVCRARAYADPQGRGCSHAFSSVCRRAERHPRPAAQDADLRPGPKEISWPCRLGPRRPACASSSADPHSALAAPCANENIQRPAAPVPADKAAPCQAGPTRPRPDRRQPQRSPRKTLDYATPNEAFNSLLAKLVSGGKTPNGGAVRYGV